MLYRLKLVESDLFIMNENGDPLTFKSFKKANEERNYLQPDIEDRIEIVVS